MPERQTRRAQVLLLVPRISSFSLTPLGYVFRPSGARAGQGEVSKFPSALRADLLPKGSGFTIRSPILARGLHLLSCRPGSPRNLKRVQGSLFKVLSVYPVRILPVKLPTGNRTLGPFKTWSGALRPFFQARRMLHIDKLSPLFRSVKDEGGSCGWTGARSLSVDGRQRVRILREAASA